MRCWHRSAPCFASRIGGLRASLFGLTALILASCAAPPNAAFDRFPRDGSAVEVLLMPIDIELSEVSAGGVLVANREWTQKAKRHLEAAVEASLASRRTRLRHLPALAEDVVADPEIAQLVKLHGAVGFSIQIHQFPSPHQLPGKQGGFSWTLGDGVAPLRGRTGADYALFILVRDSYASGSRKAAMVVGAIFGVAVEGGRQTGMASLVDLKTGDVVWFNLLNRDVGDLREAGPAEESVAALLANFPK